jgi:hypothetical protein
LQKLQKFSSQPLQSCKQPPQFSQHTIQLSFYLIIIKYHTQPTALTSHPQAATF